MTTHASLLRLLFACAVSLAVVAGCGDDEPAAPEQVATSTPKGSVPDRDKPAASKPAPTRAPTQAPRSDVAPPKSVAEQLEEKVDIPDWYPSDAPVYPGASVNRVGWVGQRVTGIFSTDDTPEKVAAWMNDFLASEEWRNVSSLDMPNGVVLRGQQDGRALTVMVTMIHSDGDEVTLVNVVADP